MRQFIDTDDSDHLMLIKEKIINTLYIIFGILAIPLAIASISRASVTGWKWIYTYYIIIASIPVIVLFFLQRISYQIKVYLALLIFISEAILGTVSFGVLGNGKLFAILIIILAGLLLGKRQGYYAFTFSMLILVIIAWLFIRKELQYSFDVKQYVSGISVWVSTILFIAGISLGLLEVFSRLMKSQAESSQKITESEKRFHTIIQQAADAVYLSDMQGRIVEVNQQSCQQTGYTSKELLRKTLMELDSSYPKLESLKELWNGMLPNQSVKIEGKHIRKDGSEFPVETSISLIELANGKHMLGFARDITERKLAEKALHESNEKYKRLANATFEGIGYSYEGQIIETNSRIIEMYGYSEDEFKNLELKDLVHPEDLSLVMEHIKKNDETPYEHRAIRKDESIFYIEARGKTVEIDNKKMRLTVLRDITERKNYEISLAASEQKFRNIFNTSSDGIIVTDFDQNILAANQLILNLTRMDEKQILSKKVYEFIVKQYQPIIQKRTQLHKKKKFIPSLEIEIDLGDNIIVPVEINSKVIDFENQLAILTLIRDISERKQLQHKIIQTIIQTEEKERSHFAKELHDGLGPLLSTMSIYTGILKDSKDEERHETAIDRIQNSVDEAILSIRQISNSLSPHVLQNFGLPEAVRNFYSKLKDIKNIDFKFKYNLEKRLNQNMELTLYRVIVELINNSVKYSGASLIKITIHLENNILKIEYADNGKGFDIERILKNTRSMGLHNIYNRINSLNGKVDLTSQEGKGMKANIKFKLR